MRIRSLTVPITVAAILVLVPAPSAGSTIVFDFTGQVSKIYDSYGLIGSLAQVGDPLTARLAYELPTSVLDSDPSPALGVPVQLEMEKAFSQ